MEEGDFTRRAQTYEQETPWILSPEFIEPLVPAVFGGGRLLDVCAGTGIIAQCAMKKGWEATALDSNVAMLEQAAASVDRVVCDAHRMPFPDGSFDLVVCRQGLQYLEPQRAVAEMLRVSSSQVRLLHGFVPERNTGLWKRLFGIAGRPGRNFFSDEALAAAIEACGPGRLEQVFMVSRQWFSKPERHRQAIDRFLEENPCLLHDHNVDDQTEGFFYDLRWVLHIVTK